jgi:hypothetical protein
MSKENTQGQNISRREFLKIAGLTAASIGVAGGLSGLLAACGRSEATTTTAAETTTTTAAGLTTTTAGVTTTTAKETTTTAGVTTTEAKALESVPLIKIESAKAAAERFGADAYSKNPLNWEINEYGGAWLHDNPTDLISRVNTAGAVVEGWIKPKKRNSEFDAITVVAHPSVAEIEIQGGTFWDFGSNQDQGFAQVLGQVREKEPKEQPGVVVIPLCDKLGSNAELGLSVLRIESAKAAAERFGADAYSKNPLNWEINEYGGAHLKDNPTDLISQIRLDGAVAEGWIKPKKRDSEFDAITIVAHPNVKVIEIQGATLWDFGSNQDQGFRQVLGQVEAKEPKEQPGVVVLPAHDCPIGQSK